MRNDYSQEEFLQMRENAISHFHKLLRNGQKISAIKIVSRVTRMGLREVKAMVERNAANLYQEEREKLFAKFISEFTELNKLLGSMHPGDRELKEGSLPLIKTTLEALEPGIIQNNDDFEG